MTTMLLQEPNLNVWAVGYSRHPIPRSHFTSAVHYSERGTSGPSVRHRSVLGLSVALHFNGLGYAREKLNDYMKKTISDSPERNRFLSPEGL